MVFALIIQSICLYLPLIEFLALRINVEGLHNKETYRSNSDIPKPTIPTWTTTAIFGKSDL